MRYRELGRTGLRVSEIGLGGGGLRCGDTDYAVRLIGRALELGVTLVDTASCYGDSEEKVGLALEGRRAQAVISTKLDARTAGEAERELEASLRRLRTDHVDVLQLHEINSWTDLDQRMGKDGAYEALVRAREDGRTRAIGVTGHRHEFLAEALRRGDFDTTMFIMNAIERDAERELIPLAVAKGLGMTVMKPLATGLAPTGLSLRFVLSHPVSAACPSATRIDWLEQNVAAVEQPFSAEDRAEADRVAADMDSVRCRVCGLCEPCPVGIPIGSTLGTFRFANEYRSMGRDQFLEFPWGEWSKRHFKQELENRLAAIPRCERCLLCQDACPHHLPIVRMLDELLPRLEEMREAIREW